MQPITQQTRKRTPQVVQTFLQVNELYTNAQVKVTMPVLSFLTCHFQTFEVTLMKLSKMTLQVPRTILTFLGRSQNILSGLITGLAKVTKHVIIKSHAYTLNYERGTRVWLYVLSLEESSRLSNTLPTRSGLEPWQKQEKCINSDPGPLENMPPKG